MHLRDGKKTCPNEGQLKLKLIIFIVHLHHDYQRATTSVMKSCVCVCVRVCVHMSECVCGMRDTLNFVLQPNIFI